MPGCPACGDDIAGGARFCSACGAAVGGASQATETSHGTPTSRARGATAVSADTPGQGRFLPGAVLAGRYRIVGLLGRGGMGEVYRADDLKLGQPVALKFLPQALERDDSRLQRFVNEVKLARQVSHPNVCRVYDMGEFEGLSFLSMEYVDGEDLASLLRRIGRLPQDKAAQIARQLCAGLAAAHEQGILHRDLKPANVMIDGRGRAKITDFGLARLAERGEGAEDGAGTPAYMAPEQAAGEQVTARSDIYALGLVLYELFTGKAAFAGGTPAELARRKRESAPTSPTSLVSGLDPAVERAILRCIERDPRERPASALAVAAALPGGDPLAAALAAGETPSPEMVADAGDVGGLRPAVGAALLAGIFAGMAGVLLLEGPTNLAARVGLARSPQELSVVARQIVAEAGWEVEPVDRAHGFAADSDYLRWVEDTDDSPGRWADLATVAPAPIYFWYRQSPDYLVPANFVGYVWEHDPPATVSGAIDVRLDPQGGLIRFHAVPPQLDESEPSGVEPDWVSLLSRAGLDAATLTAAAPVWNPLIDCDARRAWTGHYPDRPDSPVRVEAGAYRGRPVYFEVVPVWRKPARMGSEPAGLADRVGNSVFLVVSTAVLAGALLLARRNVRLGRGDRRGAFRLAVFFFVVQIGIHVLRANHVPTFAEASLLWVSVGRSLLSTGLVWIAYLALEPYLRRLWPDAIIAWSRLLDGRFRDPLIGRHILFGGLAGLVIWLWWRVPTLLRHLAGVPDPAPESFGLMALTGLPQAAAGYLNVLASGLGVPVLFTFFFLLLRVLLRRPWAAAAALVALLTVSGALGSTPPLLHGLNSLVFALIVVFIMTRLGLLAFVVSVMFSSWEIFSLTTDFSAWYAGRSLVALLVFAALAVYGFWISLAGRPLFRDEVLDAG